MTMTDERLAELDAVMKNKIWWCKVGETASVPIAADPPMREAVENAYYAITGEWPKFIFSGWGGELTEGERAVVENRLPADTSTFYDNEPIQSQVDRLAEYIMREAPDAINGGGAIETAISIIDAQAATIARLREALQVIVDDYQTSPKHHPNDILIPIASFGLACAALAKIGANQ